MMPDGAWLWSLVSGWLANLPSVGPIDGPVEWLVVAAAAVVFVLVLFTRPELPWRYVTGAPLFHDRHTDSKFLVDGTGWNMIARKEPYFAKRVPSTWSLWAGWKRSAVRLVVPAVLAGVLVAYWVAPVVTVALLVVGAVVALVVGGVAAVRWVRGLGHRREFVEPLHTALVASAGWPEEIKPTRWISLPRDFREDDAVIRLELGPAFLAGEEPDEAEAQTWNGGVKAHTREAFNAIVYEKLGLSGAEMVAAFSTAGRSSSVEYRHRAKVPARVLVEDVREELARAKATAPVLGLTRGNRPVAVDLTADSPHIGVSLDSGAGKSTMTGGMAAQFLAKGGRVVLLDPKRTSHLWVRGPHGVHPHVRVLVEISDIHDELLFIDAERNRRQRVGDDPSADVGPRILILTEEMNMLSNMLGQHWKEVKPPGSGATPPSVTAMANTAFAGRQARMHSLAVAQRFDAKLVGGGDARLNYPARIIRGDASAWRMLAPEFRRPRQPTRPGRFHLAQGGTLTEVQSIFWHSPDDPSTFGEIQRWAWSCFDDGLSHEARPLARDEFYAGVPVAQSAPAVEGFAPAPAALSADLVPVVQGAPAGPVSGHQGAAVGGSDVNHPGRGGFSPDEASPVSEEAPAEGSSSAGPVVIGLREASTDGEGLVPVTLAALRKARDRDPSFPAPVLVRGREKLYDPAAVRQWEENRPSKRLDGEVPRESDERGDA